MMPPVGAARSRVCDEVQTTRTAAGSVPGDEAAALRDG